MKRLNENTLDNTYSQQDDSGHWTDELDKLRSEGLYRVMPEIEGMPGPEVIVNGRAALNFSSNNYLGLAGHEALIEASVKAARKYGAGSTASRLIAGNTGPHRDLERMISKWKGVQAALVFTSGYQANIGALTSVAGKGDLIVSDQLNHASIIDGCRLSRAETKIYPHLDMEALERLLHVGDYDHRVIITESVFSMDGDNAPLKEIQRLADKYSASVIVDEAHGAGVFGPIGEGLCSELGTRPFLQMGTLGKALGSSGAYLAGNREVIELIINRARSFIYTTAAPPTVTAASMAAIEIVRSREGAERRKRLHENCEIFSGIINRELGAEYSSSHILPVIIGESKKTMKISENLLEKGVFAHGIRYPTVPEGSARIRFTIMSEHEGSHLQYAAAALCASMGSEICSD